MTQQSSQLRFVDLLSVLVASAESNVPIAYCRIVETRGSTPQKAGAAMLVRQGGAPLGTIGGGCIEAEVISRAQMALDRVTPEIAMFRLNGDYGWDDGLICGGRMRIAIEPVHEAAQRDYFGKLLQHIQRGRGGTEAIVIEEASQPSFCFFDETGQPIAALRDHDSIDADMMAANLQPLSNRPRAYEHQSVAYVPVFPRCRLIIVGCGHVGMAVGQLATDLDFDVCAVDDRADFASRERFPRAQEILTGPIDYVLPNLDIDENCYCLIVTRGHKQDEKALYYLVNRGARYVGLIGSRRKINLIFDDLLEQGVSADELAKVHAPVGIDIGSQTVAEIAVSIAAELVAHRNNSGCVPGRPKAVRVVAHE